MVKNKDIPNKVKPQTLKLLITLNPQNPQNSKKPTKTS